MVKRSDSGYATKIANDSVNFWIRNGGNLIVEAGGKVYVGDTEVTAAIGTGNRVAMGVHQQASATDTIVTGLTTVAAVVATWRDTPTLKQMFITATIGDQAGAPATGSIQLKSFAPTASGNVTPTAATDFTDNLSVNWVAVGT